MRWVQGVADDIAALNLGSWRVVTFGQSFHRVRRLEVAEADYDLLVPGGSLVLISHQVDGRPRLSQTRFGGSRTIYAPGRPDLIRDIDTVVANYFSLSYAAPRWFGSRRADFEAALRHLLQEHSPDGLFWDWPGDTELVIATKT